MVKKTRAKKVLEMIYSKDNLIIISLIFSVLAVLFFSSISADVISIDSGGDAGLVIGPDAYLGGFFSAADITPPIVTIISPGGGGPSAPSVPSVEEIEFSVGPELFEKTMMVNKTAFGEITITNEGVTDKYFNLNIEVLEDMISFEETTIKVDSKSTKRVEFEINSPNKPGIYAGKILVSSEDGTKEILLLINVESERSLFDIIVTIPANMKTMVPGKNLKARIELLEMGSREFKDVILNYLIKDFEGNTYLQESETVAVADRKTLNKEFHTEEFLLGNYVLGVELIYPEGVAVASSHFSIKEFEIEIKQMIIIISIIVVIISFIATILIIKKYKRMVKHVKKK